MIIPQGENRQPDLHGSQGEEMTAADFKKISALIYERCGINLHDGKKELVKARLGKRFRKGQFKSFGEYYYHVLQDPTGQELVSLLDAISTNFTSFFREESHFDYLKSDFLPELILRKRDKKKFVSGAPVAPQGRNPIPSPSL